MKKKIRALFIQPQIDPSSVTTVHSLLIRNFDRERVEPHVACPITGTNGQPAPAYDMWKSIPGLHIHPTKFGSLNFEGTKIDVARKKTFAGLALAASMTGLVRYVKQHSIEVVHVSEMPRDALCGILLAKLTNAKCIFHLHVQWGNWMSSRVNWALRDADGIIGISQFVIQSILTRGFLPEKIHLVHNGLDLSNWHEDTGGQKIRQEFNIPNNVPLLTSISHLVPWKGHESLLKALVKVREEIPDFRLLIVGDELPGVSLPDGSSYKVHLKNKVFELGLDEQVIFAGSRSDIQQILAACDISALPSHEEGFGLSHLEAMAMQKPVIALESGATSEVVEHGKSGLLSLPDDVSQLAANILTLIHNPTLRSQMGAYGRLRVEHYFNPRRMADQVEDVYRLVLRRLAVPQLEDVQSAIQ